MLTGGLSLYEDVPGDIGAVKTEGSVPATFAATFVGAFSLGTANSFALGDLQGVAITIDPAGTVVTGFYFDALGEHPGDASARALNPALGSYIQTLQSATGTQVTFAETIAAIPEPGSLSLLALAGVVRWIQRRRK